MRAAVSVSYIHDKFFGSFINNCIYNLYLFFVHNAFGKINVTQKAEKIQLHAGIKEKDSTKDSLPAEQALNLYGNAILRLAYAYLHNMCDAEDILQETLLKYLQSAPDFKSAEHQKAWLLRVAANLSKNKIDYNRIRETDELEETLAAENRKDLSFVWEAVKMLPIKYREVIHLFYYEGYSVKEIGRILQRNENSVRSDLKRGRDRLKEVLKEVYDFE